MHPLATKVSNPVSLLQLLFLSPLLLIPFMDIPMPGASEALFCVFGVLHLMVLPAAWLIGEGRASKVFATTIALMLPAIVGNTALAFFMVVNTSAVMHEQGIEQGCGMVALAIFFAPFYTAALFGGAGVVLAAAAAVVARLRPGAPSGPA